MFSPEEGVTKFATLPKALKYVKSCNMNDDEVGVDFSRLCKDRFWLGPADIPKLQWLLDKPVWQRRDQYSTSPRASKTPEDWKHCTECKYLIDDDEFFRSCQKTRNPYHSDCLLKHDKLVPPCFDRKLLDEQAVKYALANKKWKARITSKNPSLAIEEDGMRGATQSIYGGGVVFGVNNQQAATSTLICHPSSEYLATHRAQGTTGTVPSAINFSTLCKSP